MSALRGAGALALSLAALMAVSAASFPADVTRRDRGGDVRGEGLTKAERKALDIRAIRADAVAGLVFVDVLFAGNFERLAGRGHLKQAVAGIVFVEGRRKGRVIMITGRGRTRARLGRGATGVALADGRTVTFAMQGFDPRRARELAVASLAPASPPRRRAGASITEALLEYFLRVKGVDEDLKDRRVLPERDLDELLGNAGPGDCAELRARKDELFEAQHKALENGLVVDISSTVNRINAALTEFCGDPVQAPLTPPPPPPPDDDGDEEDGERLKDHLVPGGGANQIAPANSLYFTTDQAQPHRVGVVSAAGVGSQFNVPDPTGSPQGITLGPDGNAWFVESADDEVVRMTPTGGFTEFPIPAGSFGQPVDIASGADGKLWYVEQSGTRVVSITTDGMTQTPYSLDPGSSPTSIVAGPDGRLWYTQFFDNEIGAITTAGVIQEFTVPTANSRPTGITVGPDNAIWFTERDGQKLGRIATNAGSGADITEFPVPAGTNPDQITSGPDGRLWFTRRFGAVIGAMTSLGALEEITLGTPTRGIASDGGKIWVAANDRIVEVTP